MNRRYYMGALLAGTAMSSYAMSAFRLKKDQMKNGLGRSSFNEGWRFRLGAAEGAEASAYGDSDWRALDLPHDWAIEGPFDVKYNARCGGLPFHGTGWYRKTFDVPAEAKGNVVSVTFDGAMYNAHVWVNGHFLAAGRTATASFNMI